jgi:hypothetical protein
MPKHAYKPLDDAAFRILEELGSSKDDNGAKIKFSADAEKNLKTAILWCGMRWELSEAWSRETEDVTRAVMNCDELQAGHARLILEKPVRLYFLLKEEGIAELEFLVYKESTAEIKFLAPIIREAYPGRKAEEAHRLLSDFVAGALLPDGIKQELIDGATRRMDELDPEKKPRKREADTPIWQFCVDAIRVFNDSGGNATIGSKGFARYMGQLFHHLPYTIRPGLKSSPGALVQHAKRALMTLNAKRPDGGARIRIRKVGAAGDQAGSDNTRQDNSS